MNRPPNPYRDEHRRLEAEGGHASNRGDYRTANGFWREAARLKRRGQDELRDQLIRTKGTEVSDTAEPTTDCDDSNPVPYGATCAVPTGEEGEGSSMIELRDTAFEQMRQAANLAIRGGGRSVTVDAADLIGLIAELDTYREMESRVRGRVRQDGRPSRRRDL